MTEDVLSLIRDAAVKDAAHAAELAQLRTEITGLRDDVASHTAAIEARNALLKEQAEAASKARQEAREKRGAVLGFVGDTLRNQWVSILVAGLVGIAAYRCGVPVPVVSSPSPYLTTGTMLPSEP